VKQQNKRSGCGCVTVILLAVIIGVVVATSTHNSATTGNTGTPANTGVTPAGSNTGNTGNTGRGCSPMTDSGGCYEPGEYCRDSDHGVSGVAGDGETITCEDNDGWRWEPS